MGWTIWDLNCGGRERVFSCPKHLDWLWVPPNLLFSGYRLSFLGVKEPGHEVNDALPSSAEVKNEGSYTLYEKNCL